MLVDFHNHYFPPAYLDAVRSGGTSFRVTEDEAGNPVLHSPGDYNVLVITSYSIHYTKLYETLEPQAARVGGFTFTLLEVAPAPTSQGAIDPERYTIKVRIED